jgi:hypothetical protein
MTSVNAVDPTTSGSSPTDTSDLTTVQDVFEQGLLKLALTMLQGAESDIISAINDDSSDPDAVG